MGQCNQKPLINGCLRLITKLDHLPLIWLLMDGSPSKFISQLPHDMEPGTLVPETTVVLPPVIDMPPGNTSELQRLDVKEILIRQLPKEPHGHLFLPHLEGFNFDLYRLDGGFSRRQYSFH